MIKCEICGHENKFRLIEHIQKTHNMNIDEYKNQYGEVVSEEYKKKVSEKSIEKWKDDEYRQKTIESKLFVYTEEVRNKMSKKVKEFYDNGGKSWNEGLTKDIDDRVANIGKFNRINLSGRTKEDYGYLKKHSELMISLWNDSNLKKRREEIHNDPIQNKKYKEKNKKKDYANLSKKVKG